MACAKHRLGLSNFIKAAVLEMFSNDRREWTRLSPQAVLLAWILPSITLQRTAGDPGMEQRMLGSVTGKGLEPAVELTLLLLLSKS
ncbi:hypothetical protein AX761_20885 [Rhizobium sp. 58]|nr:hypothetical protein AX761_20885 [Rhizobium sp. 58]